MGELDDEVTVRIVFSSYVKEEQSLCLRLKRDWRRLAPALSLTEEVRVPPDSVAGMCREGGGGILVGTKARAGAPDGWR